MIICIDHVVTNLQRSGVVYPNSIFFKKASDFIAQLEARCTKLVQE